MKIERKAVRICLVCILAVCIALPVLTFAREDTFIELPERIGTSPEIVLEIPFDAPLMASTVSTGNVYVMDDQGSKVPLSRKMGSEWKSIIIEPLAQYEAGKAYTLYIRNAVKYATGSRLKEGFKMKFTIAKAAAEPLPTVGSRENLRKLLEEAAEQDYYMDYGIYKRNGLTAVDTAAAAPASAAAESAGSSNKAKQAADEGSGDYSTTNVQVEGVDEADIVKTDGKYLYQVNNNRIVVAEIYPSDKMKITKIISLEEENVYPTELYLDNKYLILIGASNNSIPVYRPGQSSIMPEYYPHYSNETVKLMAYDITDKSNIKKVREIEMEGSYLSSRKIGSKLYLVSNKRFNYHRILDNAEVNDTPSYRDTAVKEEFINIDHGKIEYFPGSVEPNYMIVAGVNFDLPKEGVNVSTYLGSGESIYASAENLYVAVTRYNNTRVPSPKIYDSAAPKKIEIKVNDRETVIYRFALNNGKLDYTGKGSVPGSILNQFSMDEDKGYFRIATTKGNLFGEGENISKNNMYVLDSDMNTCGSLEDIAPGERIYSVRFMGDRAYMVTFKKVDPLFVIDLKDPQNPAILGALKIPGYSDYLHPYDENHIIGFGKDTIELSNEGIRNREGTTAYYQGMKIALFDVSDVSNPKEKFKEIIGDRGTDSELLNNHKALLFSKKKELMAFPVTVMEIESGGNVEENRPVYGSFSFQGAYVYNIDLEEGFKLRARISHISEEEYKKAGDRWYRGNMNVERIIYIGDDLYTISKGMIKANSMTDMKEKGSLLIP
ncbi:MAG TPA: beta-propeller domain-containing protein [Bacillota bacterium]|nr:beta-propeller domain-containing protein [Bacillota bacterium]HQA66635.1 beta-propeller domain-containing protein [Bacillota bacterium]HQO41946.1 beta-propeller domain-containing protein [Bacillota bacterium]HQQ44899.1 beta-propeller domain-containing protein [Bacillota bacterium]